MEIQGSQNPSSYPWQSGYLYIQAYPGQYSELNIRTRMTIASGETQGWSFGLEADAAQLLEFQAGGGYLWLGPVTTAGTHVETLNPSVNSTAARAATGYTQGVVVDTSQQQTLPPVSGFVTSKACYSFTAPYEEGYWAVRLKFTHDVGNPRIRSVVTQGSQSNVPCARNFDLIFIVSEENSYYGACGIQGASGFSGPGTEGAGLIEEGGGTPLALTGADPCQAPPSIVGTFRRGDSNSDGDLDISDPIGTLDFLFLGVYQPTCMEALDANDDNEVDVSDPVYTLASLFLQGPPLHEPYLDCGADFTPPALGCVSYPPCTQGIPCWEATVGTASPNVSQRRGHQSEPAIAVYPLRCNPLDPAMRSVVVLANDHRFPCASPFQGLLRAASWDGGLTWPVTGLVFTGHPDLAPSGTADPALAYDEFGNLYASYNGLDGKIRAAVSPDGGITFPAALSYEFGIGDKSTIKTGPPIYDPPGILKSQTVWLATRQGSEAGSRIIAAGALATKRLGTTTDLSFTTYVLTDPNAECLCSYTDIAIGPNREVVVVYQDEVGSTQSGLTPGKCPSNILVHFRQAADPADTTKSFSGPQIAGQTQVCGPNKAFDFIPAQPLFANGVYAQPTLAVDRAGGKFFLAFLDEEPDESNDTFIRILAADLPPPGTLELSWTEIHQIGMGDGRSQFFQRIEVDQTTGFAGMAWYDAIEDPQNIRVKLYAAHNSGRGTPFLAPFPVSSGASDGRASNDVLGDYIGLAFHDRLFFTVWADNSDPALSGEAEIFADRRVIPGE